MRPWMGLLAVVGACRSERLSVVVELDPRLGASWSEVCEWNALAAPDLDPADVIRFGVDARSIRPCDDPPAERLTFTVERSRPEDAFLFEFLYREGAQGRVTLKSGEAQVSQDGFTGVEIVTEESQVVLTPLLEDCFLPGDDDGDRLDGFEEPECLFPVSCDRDRTGCRDLSVIASSQGEGAVYGWNSLASGTWRVDGDVVTEGPDFSPSDVVLWTRGLADGRHVVTFEQDYPSPGIGSAVITVPAETNQFLVPVLWSTTCHDGFDQDGNGLVDCDDPACVDACADVERCDDGVDQDGDGLADCLDPDCADDPHCLGGEDCTNAADDDCDALVDCADVADCGAHPTCLPEGECADGLDDDGDGSIDCADNDCSADPDCVDSCGQALVVAGAYTEGGAGPTSWNQDFVELGNRSDTAQDLSQVWLHVMDGLGNWYVFDVQGTVPAHGYYLVQLGGSGQNRPLPSPDHVAGPFVPDLSAFGSGVVLSGSPTPAAARQCPTADVIDRLGFNGGLFCAEGYVGPSGTPTDTEGFRRVDTCVDTDDNTADFALTAMTGPRNSAVAGASCGCP